ncbi:hypothetical protein ACIA8I_38500 [Streptomyces rishiriensis]|uniref:hypothetical protein n=1 Tax=Streptomyces rishiriensis TaxID=68264 RepID=UPI003787C236
MDVAFEERLLPAGGEDAVHRLAGVGQAQAEQAADQGLPGQVYGDVPEVDLGFLPGMVGLRHEHLRAAASGLGPDLAPAHCNIDPDDAVGNPVRMMLIDQTIEDTLGGVPLLARGIQVRPQHLVHQPTGVELGGRALRGTVALLCPVLGSAAGTRPATAPKPTACSSPLAAFPPPATAWANGCTCSAAAFQRSPMGRPEG